MFHIEDMSNAHTAAVIRSKSANGEVERVGVITRLPDRCDMHARRWEGCRSPQWWRIVCLIDAAPDLKQALRDLMDAYACELGVPAEACDKGVMARAWAAIRKAEGVA